MTCEVMSRVTSLAAPVTLCSRWKIDPELVDLLGLVGADVPRGGGPDVVVTDEAAPDDDDAEAPTSF
jgi:hypothetical protein